MKKLLVIALLLSVSTGMQTTDKEIVKAAKATKPLLKIAEENNLDADDVKEAVDEFKKAPNKNTKAEMIEELQELLEDITKKSTPRSVTIKIAQKTISPLKTLNTPESKEAITAIDGYVAAAKKNADEDDIKTKGDLAIKKINIVLKTVLKNK